MEFKIGFPYGWIILWRKTEKEKRKSISVLSPSFRGQVRAQSVVDIEMTGMHWDRKRTPSRRNPQAP